MGWFLTRQPGPRAPSPGTGRLSRRWTRGRKSRLLPRGLCAASLTWPMCLWHRHVHHSTSILRFGGRCSEPADPRFGRGAGGQTVCVLVRPCRQLLRGGVGYEALCDGELGVPQLLFHLGVLVGPGQFFVSGGGTFCGDHAASRAICRVRKRTRRIRYRLSGAPRVALCGPWLSRPRPRATQPGNGVSDSELPLSAWGPLCAPRGAGRRDLCFSRIGPSLGRFHQSAMPKKFCVSLK